jgi:hypothetical protein
MRVEKSVTSVTWIPSEAISGMTKLPFEMGVAHYDDPPPDRLDDLEALGAADAFREANQLRAWVEFEDGKPALYGYSGAGHIGVTPTSASSSRPVDTWACRRRDACAASRSSGFAPPRRGRRSR